MNDKPIKQTTSTMLLGEAKSIQEKRAAEYGQPGGERSMKAIVAAFNAITGHALYEAQGWLFMTVLKQVRNEAAKGHDDSCLDFVSYASLYGEASLREKAEKEPAAKTAAESATVSASLLAQRQVEANYILMKKLLSKVKEQHTADVAKAIIQSIGKAQKVFEIDDDLIPAVIAHIRKCYPMAEEGI